MSSSQTTLDSNLLVKDLDGQFKVLQDGILSPINDTKSSVAPSSPIPIPSAAQPAAIPPDEHFLLAAPEKLDPASKADFHFHPDDRQDIASELEKINAYLSSTERKKYSVEKIAEKLVEKNELKFSPDQYARFVESLLSFFRQARSFVQMRALLADTGAIGFGLDMAVADKVMMIARSLKEKIESVDGIVVEAGGERGSEEASMTSKQPEMKAPLDIPATPEPSVKNLPEMENISPAPQPVPSIPTPASESVPVSSTPIPPAPESQTVTDLPKVNRPMTDVAAIIDTLPKVKRPGSRVVGKVDELATMTLQDFRTLDPDPRMRVAKILQRIINLGKESLLRRAQGIDGWRKNEVYQHYLAIGHQSLEQGMDIGQAITALESAGQPTLTLEEFEAITDLNKHLRF
jgi:hypothetical protein